MCGGADENSFSLTSVERFDSRVGEWQNVEPMYCPRLFAGAALLNSKIYVAGGWNNHRKAVEYVEM